MESLNRPSQSQNDGNILLGLYDQLEKSNSTADKIKLQTQINIIIAHNFLLYTNGTH